MTTLCEAYQARFEFLLPPGFGSGEAPLVRAAKSSATDLMIPFHMNALGRERFKDGLHLNAFGTQIFTDKLAALLMKRLGNNKASRIREN